MLRDMLEPELCFILRLFIRVYKPSVMVELFFKNAAHSSACHKNRAYETESSLSCSLTQCEHMLHARHVRVTRLLKRGAEVRRTRRMYDICHVFPDVLEFRIGQCEILNQDISLQNPDSPSVDPNTRDPTHTPHPPI